MRSHDLNRLLDEPGPERRAHSKYVFWKLPGLTFYRASGGVKPRASTPKRRPMAIPAVNRLLRPDARRTEHSAQSR